MGCRTRELKEKTVISVCDGRSLGNICDFEVDTCDGRIEAIFVPGCYGGSFWNRGDDIRIPWSCINRIGEDAILVDGDYDHSDCSCCKDQNPRKKRRWF
ncbi:MAG: YlmC/YmxH family sporulation protein [Ruminococcaceae bacterium]|nr:YlmC/YmxH family sporulation protein [Oscillospiraceae bacterium]